MNTSIGRGRQASKAAEAQPNTPTRRSARLRGAGVEFTPDRLDQVHRHL